jgi:hypothetical protein
MYAPASPGERRAERRSFKIFQDFFWSIPSTARRSQARA